MEKRIRLDKYVSDYTELTRSQAKKEIHKGNVQVNGTVVTKGDEKVSFSDLVCYNQREIRGEIHQYIMFHKPAGIVSAITDNRDTTVVEYVRERIAADGSSACLAKDLFPVGRLDKDTEGLLILTNDGQLAHRLLSPARHVPKKYYVKLKGTVSETDIEKVKEGLDIGEKRRTKPAVMEILSERECILTITEGKFHQVKRMFECLGNTVVYLKRIQMAGIVLDEKLHKGGWRFLTEQEIEELKRI